MDSSVILYRNGYTQLLLQLQKNDSQAFGEFYATLSPVVRNFIISFNGQLCPHEREDLVHETFLAIWENRGSYRGEASAKTYMLAIAKNLTRKYLSKRQRSSLTYMGDFKNLSDEKNMCEQEALSAIEFSEIQEIIHQAIGSLTDVQRQTIELDRIFGLPRSKSLKLANCTPNQFQKRLQRAMKALRRLLRNLQKNATG